ncbi:MAG: M15 family metallopeptidase [Acidimicrobiia bacterium]|nr:M15 family metallopeptidase [Acidimicrobiia bacterium]
MNRTFLAPAVAIAVTLSACGGSAGADEAPTTLLPAPTTTSSTPTTPPTTVQPPTTTTTTVSPFARPDWLGTRPLPLRDDGHGAVLATPTELVDRRLETVRLLPPPASGEFEFTIQPVPDDVLARSSWTPDCPVGVDGLAYVTVSHVGFDGGVHTGELLVNAAWAEEIVGVFREIFEARFPIEQMRVIRLDEVDDPPTGDWNETTSFVCRPAVGNTSWSQHAYGLAIDVNPFHNPYEKGDLVIPELASAYTDRALLRPGMIQADDVVVEAFAAIGWAWGGEWNSLKDWMHFSASGG